MSGIIARVSEILRLSDIYTTSRCPSCARAGLVHSSRSSNVNSMDDVPLWDFIEECTMCGHERTWADVKIGV